MNLTYNITQTIAIYQFLQNTQLPRRVYKYLKSHHGLFLVNGQAVEVNRLLHSGDVLELVFPKETLSLNITPYPLTLDVMYEDAFFLIVNKPYGLATIPTKAHPKKNLANAVAHYYTINEIDANIHLINRLDKDTSGLVMLAKNRYIHHLMQDKLHDTLHRTYHAVVEGVIAQSGSIDAPIAKANEGIKREIHPSGKPAMTFFERLYTNGNTSSVKLKLLTGRTHQLRVHLASIGHPIVGDPLYGNNLGRLHLHSASLSFIHPISNEYMEIFCPVTF